jgi:hypothetical protein
LATNALITSLLMLGSLTRPQALRPVLTTGRLDLRCVARLDFGVNLGQPSLAQFRSLGC